MAFGQAKSGGLGYDPSHWPRKVRSAVPIVGGLGDFQYVLKIQMHGLPLRRG